MERLEAEVYGRVQGVTFRATTRDKARQLGLTGWVRNRREGHVETVVEGPRDTLDTFVEYLHEGPPAANVKQVETEFTEATDEFDHFQIRRTV